MAQTALVIAWPHSSDTVNSLASQLSGGLSANRIEVTVLDLAKRRHWKKLRTFGKQSFDHVFLLGSIPLRLKFDAVPVYEYFEANCYFWVLDPIIYDLAAIPETRDYFAAAQKSRRLFFLFPDRSYRDLVAENLNNQCIYFPFAGNHPNTTARELATKRPEVLVLANVGNELNESASQSLRDIIDNLDPFGLNARQREGLIDHVINDERYSNVTSAVFNFMRLDLNEIFKAPVAAFLAALDSSEKRRRRLSTVESINSLNIHIVGSGWRELMGDRPNIVYQPHIVRHDFLANCFANYKVLLDFAPNWDHGFNDRVLTCIGAGCRVVTSRNAAIDEIGVGATVVSTYSVHHPKPEPELEKALAAPPVDQTLIAMIEAEYNWAKRITGLLGEIRFTE